MYSRSYVIKTNPKDYYIGMVENEINGKTIPCPHTTIDTPDTKVSCKIIPISEWGHGKKPLHDEMYRNCTHICTGCGMPFVSPLYDIATDVENMKNMVHRMETDSSLCEELIKSRDKETLEGLLKTLEGPYRKLLELKNKQP